MPDDPISSASDEDRIKEVLRLLEGQKNKGSIHTSH